NRAFNRRFTAMLDGYETSLGRALLRPVATVLSITGMFFLSLALYPLIGKTYFPRTDPGQFVINLKAPTGTRLELTDQLVGKVEQVVREVVPAKELKILVSNIGSTPGFSSIYTPNSGPHTAFVQVGLEESRSHSSFEYMDQVRARLRQQLPLLSTYFQTGGLVDAVLNLGLPAPLDVQVSGTNMEAAHGVAAQLAHRTAALRDVSDVLLPQDIDYPSLKLDIDRVHASELGLNEKEVVGNVITALTSNGMIAPSYWVDPKTGNDYLLTVQYPENIIHNFADLRAVPLRGTHSQHATQLDTVSSITHINSPTEVDHYQLRRVMDVYVSPAGEDLTGVLLTLFLTGTTLNVMSLMGVVMMVGIVVSNSILIVEFTNRLRREGRTVREAVSLACRVRLRPVLMTSLATLIGLIPMALKLGTGAEAYAPLARAIIGGLAVSVVLTVFIVPAAYYLAHRRDEERRVRAAADGGPAAGPAA